LVRRNAAAVGAALEAAAEIYPVDEQYPQHKWLIALAVMLGTILEILDSSIVNVSLPHMQGSFSASVDEVTWVVTSYLVANGIMIPLTGWISARFGRKRYFMLSVSTFVIASAMCGAAQTLDQMVIFRLLQGFAGAAMAPSSQAIMMETFPPQEQQLAMATWSLGLMVAPVLGPTVGGWITDNWSWRWNFYINIPIGLLATLMVYMFLHDPPYLKVRRGGKVDYLGIVCLTTGLGLMQMVADRGQRADWFSSPWVTYATAGCVIALAIFTWRELTFPDPVVDLSIFKYPMFTVTVVLTVMLSFAQYGANLLNPIFLQEYMGYTAWKAGLALAPRAFGTVFSLLLVGQLARYGFNTRTFIGPAFVLTALALWQMSHWNAQISMWQVTGPVILQGVGTGLVFPQLSAISLASVTRERMGYASSLFNMMRNTGAAIGISFLTSLFINAQQLHQSRLAEHFSIFDAWRLSEQAPRMPGSPAFGIARLQMGHKEGLAMIYNLIQAQAAVLAFNDLYRMLAAFLIVMIPFYFVLRRAPMSVGAEPGH
jgi:MFS transporter, DHA2 family, multidrug resistance protein